MRAEVGGRHMKWVSIALLITLSAAAQTPEEKEQALNVQGNRLAEETKYTEAMAVYQEALDIWRSLGPDYAGHTAGTLLNYGMALSGSGQRPAAVKALEEALALHRKSLGPNHHRTLANMNLLASNYLMLGDNPKAEALLSVALPIARRFFPDDVQTARTLEGLAALRIKSDLASESLPLAEEALAV